MSNVILACLLLFSLLLHSTANADNTKTYQVKAAYLYQFLKFIDWPKEIRTDKKSIGIVSNEDLTQYFTPIKDKVFSGKKVNIYFIKHIESALHCCDIIYFAPNTELQLQQLSQKLKKGVVIVADETLENGNLSMIQLHKKGTKLKFIINAYNANNKDVDLSSRLLRVAIKINHHI